MTSIEWMEEVFTKSQLERITKIAKKLDPKYSEFEGVYSTFLALDEAMLKIAKTSTVSLPSWYPKKPLGDHITTKFTSVHFLSILF